MIVGRPAASARSQGPDISRAVGQRRFSETSQAAMQLGQLFVRLEITRERDARSRARVAHIGRDDRSAGRRAGEQQVRGGGVREDGRERVENLRDALFRRQPAEDAEDESPSSGIRLAARRDSRAQPRAFVRHRRAVRQGG